MLCFPNSKINIGLSVLRKRQDGYHDIQSVFYPIGLCDALEVIDQAEVKNTLLSGFSGIPVPGDTSANLCNKAYGLISKDYPLPGLRMHLHKHIPIGAGLGGGSSDGAHFIALVNDHCGLGLSWGEKHHYARQLGSDCSFFISNKPALVSGRGDQIESIGLNLKGYYLVVVCPPVHVSTAEAYSSLHPEENEFDLEHFLINNPVSEWRNHVSNDFEKSVFLKYPLLASIKEKLYNHGALYASMSGSGSSIYGFFEKTIDLKHEFNDCFVWQETL